MPRTYGTIECSIWDDPDFIMLGAGAQRTYLMLTTQPDISACGTLPLTLRRWSKTCRDKDLRAWLDELAEARFVIIDEDAEELFVRTFAKYDGGYRHAVRVKAVMSTAQAIRSPMLREACAAELAKLGLLSGTPEPPDSDRSATPEAVESCGSVVTKVSTDHTPESSLLDREPEPSGAAGPPSMFCSKHPFGTEQPCGPCGTAKRRYIAYAQAKTEREIAARQEAQKRKAECPHCDEKGMRLDKETRKPIGRCNHIRVAS